MKFNYYLLAVKINEKMFAIMAQQKKKFGLRYFADVIKISSATLSRVLNQKSADVNTILTILNWLDLPFEGFIIHKTFDVKVEFSNDKINVSFE